MTNGLPSSNSTQNSSRKKKNYKDYDRNNSKRKSRKNSISKYKRRKEEKNLKNNNKNNILNCSKSKLRPTINVKEKRKINMKERFYWKSRWEISRSKIKTRERKLRRRRKINSISSWLKRSKKKSLSKNMRWRIENWKNWTDSSKSCLKTMIIKKDWRNKPKENSRKYRFIYPGYQSSVIIRQTPRWTRTQEIIRKEIKRRKDQSRHGFFCRFCHQGSERTDQSWGWKDDETYWKPTQEREVRRRT